ncbi:hypothetical protein DID88_007439 [Monilinia fructigena]|uniref:ATP-dependent DNA helicase n=1 Tax=Monilinia fructigena TaxID=38457 RepID=A0A395J9E6_9HELO|nr:hypothetical protein DID88_007439 [Monilinia fructigena]
MLLAEQGSKARAQGYPIYEYRTSGIIHSLNNSILITLYLKLFFNIHPYLCLCLQLKSTHPYDNNLPKASLSTHSKVHIESIISKVFSLLSTIHDKLSTTYPQLNTPNVCQNILHVMGKKGPKKNYFVVCRGRTTGILNGWSQCEASTSGFPNAKFKGYKTYDDARKAWNEWLGSQGIAPTEGTPQDTLENNLRDTSTIVNQIAIPNDLQSHAGLKWKHEQRDSSDIIVGATTNSTRTIKSEDNVTSTGDIIIDLTESPEPAKSYGDLSIFDDSNFPAAKRAKIDGNNPALSLDIEIPDSEFEFSDDDIFDNLTICKDAPKSVELTTEQDAVVKMAMSGDNIFLTGAAGSGKTVTLLQIIGKLKQKLHDDNSNTPKVQVAAPTGLAALPLNGRTTYSVAGWRPDSFKQRLDQLLKSVKKRTIKASILERLNLLFQTVKDNTKPFGGIQVIFLGDFYQLPPVKPFEHCMICGVEMVGVFNRVCKSSRCMNREDNHPFKPGEKWAFNAPVWKQLNFRHVKLEQIHRQKDETFKAVLNKVRNGIDLSDAEWHDLIRPKELPPSAFPIRLMARRYDVEKFNNSQLGLIKSEAMVWDAYDDSWGKNPWRPVVKFADGRTSAIAPVPSETLMGTAEDRYLTCRTQIPLLLAWALSIHKSQGMTMEHVEVSRKDIFESGQLYVALSRATTLEGLTVTGYSREQIAMDEDVVEFYQKTKWENLQSFTEAAITVMKTSLCDLPIELIFN